MSEQEQKRTDSPPPGEDPRRPTVLLETSEKTNVIGFTAEGWNWDDKIPSILTENLDITELKKKFVDLYRTVSFQHKEILFSWAIIAPFLYVYRKIENIMPILLLTGPSQTGKTTYLRLIAHLYGSSLTNESVLSSSSRLENVLASSTFPVMIDDCSSDLGFAGSEILKAYSSIDCFKVRKDRQEGSKSFRSISTPLTAPTILVFPKKNREEILMDEIFMSRCIQIELTKVIPNSIWNCVPKGGLMRLIVEYTKMWTLKDLKQFVDSIPSDHIPGGQRKKAMYVALAAGAKLLYGIFGIIVDLTPLAALFLDQ
jgi:Cdc6-like AAA superfamily ATPase